MTDTPTHDELLMRRVAALELDREMHRVRLDSIDEHIISLSEIVVEMGKFASKSASTLEKLAEHINNVSGKVNLLRADLDSMARIGSPTRPDQ